MRVYCPSCGMTTTWGKDTQVEIKVRKIRAWYEHVLGCRTAPWLPLGSSRDWGTLSFWQAKRLVLIRDSVYGGTESPWDRHPVCQSCGHISGTRVDWALRGRADGMEIQHIRPKKDGGTNHPENLAVLCRRCHVRTFRFAYRGVPNSARASRLECFPNQD